MYHNYWEARETMIGKIIKEERENRGLRLEDLARRAGISAGVLAEIEEDGGAPEESTLHRLLREIFSGISPPPPFGSPQSDHAFDDAASA
jgi:transcriptional regulator with XRE-family HTH domain